MGPPSGAPDDRLLLVLRSALAWRDAGVDLSDPEVARSVIASTPPEARDMARAMAVLLRMRPSVDSPEWAAMTEAEQDEVMIRLLLEMPAEFLAGEE